MIVAVTDTETTGLDENAEVCEVAIVYVATARERVPAPRSQLIKPSRASIDIKARAVHHITDVMLVDQPTMLEFLDKNEPFKRASIFAGHNALFDRRMLIQSGMPDACIPSRTVCTLACAKHLVPDAPAYSNQVLRYYLNVEIELDDNTPMHRALPDALVTAAIFNKLYAMSDIDTLLKLTNEPVLLKTVPFGQYRGKLWSEVADLGYLRWILRKPDFNKDVQYTASHWLKMKEVRSK